MPGTTLLDSTTDLHVPPSQHPCREPPRDEEALLHQDIADLPFRAIHRMDRSELVRLIRSARFLQQVSASSDLRLWHYDLATLRRLAFLARKCCQALAVKCSPPQFAADFWF